MPSSILADPKTKIQKNYKQTKKNNNNDFKRKTIAFSN